MKLQIQSLPGDEKIPYSHLMPMVEFLLKNGNACMHKNLFHQDRDGWRCDLVKPINFDALREHFEIPSSILLSEETNSILCKYTWCEIKGGNDNLDAAKVQPETRSDFIVPNRTTTETAK